jgi:hypothetical protein
VQGRGIVVSASLANVVFAATAIPAVAGVEAFDDAAVATALVLFGISLVVWPWALGRAFVRSAEGDDIAVASLFLTMGEAPTDVRWHLFGALALGLVLVAATAAHNPFGVLVPMLHLGYIGLWAARYGVFPPRRSPAGRST